MGARCVRRPGSLVGFFELPKDVADAWGLFEGFMILRRYVVIYSVYPVVPSRRILGGGVNPSVLGDIVFPD